MSKGSKRKSAKHQARVYKAISNEYRQPAPTPIKNTAHLTMTDEQIDSTYWNMGKADRTRLKREAAKERLRLQVKAELEKEQS
jgi:hypothetical protein